MNNLEKKIEILANVSIIIVAILLSIVLVQHYLLREPDGSLVNRPATSGKQAQIGEKINLPDVDWQKNGRTLLLALSTTCRFCAEGAPLYQKIVKERDRNLRVVAVFPQSVTDAEGYLDRLGVAVDEVKQTSFTEIGVNATPTMILVDDKGAVTDTWVGVLPENEGAAVINRVRQNLGQE